MRLLTRAAGASCLSLILALPAGAQTMQLGVKGGYDRSTFGGQNATGTEARSDFAGGVFLTLPLAPVFALQPELLYVPRGAQVTESGFTGKFKLDYAVIPVLARVLIPTQGSAVRPAIFAGPYVGLKTSCKVEVSGGGFNGSMNCDAATQGTTNIKGTDFGATFGGGLDLDLGGATALIEARYDLGLTTIDATTNPDDVKNRGILVFVGFSFPIGSGRAATSRKK